jgi:hypothetical protein
MAGWGGKMSQHNSVSRLQRLMIDGGEKAFDLVPSTLKNVINERQWAEQKDKNGKLFQSFETFVSHRLWQGLESSIDDLLAYCRKRPDVQLLIRGAVGALAEHGGGRTSEQGDNITLTPSRGTNPTYILKRLKRDHPELAAKVVVGEMSANAAAIKAGFRKKPKQKQWVCPKCGCAAVLA